MVLVPKNINSIGQDQLICYFTSAGILILRKKQSQVVRTNFTRTPISLSYKRTVSANQIPADNLVPTTRVHSYISSVICAPSH